MRGWFGSIRHAPREPKIRWGAARRSKTTNRKHINISSCRVEKFDIIVAPEEAHHANAESADRTGPLSRSDRDH